MQKVNQLTFVLFLSLVFPVTSQGEQLQELGTFEPTYSML